VPKIANMKKLKLSYKFWELTATRKENQNYKYMNICAKGYS